jgi:DNA processing protein
MLRFGSADSALAAIPDLARRGGRKHLALFARDKAEKEIEAVDRLGARYLMLGQGLYPRALAELDDAPPILTVKGRLELLDHPMVSIVGARNASAAACRFARGLAHDLGEEGLSVVSGLARGIDTAAHDGSFATGTIAVIAGGLDVFYPPENEGRQREISESGLLIAEMPPCTEPRARHFPYRNRIIAGLAAGTVVVEAAPQSGSLITARLAAEAGREVLAVPGSPLDPRAQGCNQLIRDGATLVQNAADVLESIGTLGGALRAPLTHFDGQSTLLPQSAGEEIRIRVEELLGPSPAPVDEIVRLSGAEPGEVQLVLLELDLAGRLDRHAGNKVSLS